MMLRAADIIPLLLIIFFASMIRARDFREPLGDARAA